MSTVTISEAKQIFLTKGSIAARSHLLTVGADIISADQLVRNMQLEKMSEYEVQGNIRDRAIDLNRSYESGSREEA